MLAKSHTAVARGYRCHFEPEPEGGYTVTCPKLPPVVTYGTDLAEARANAREAIELVLEVYRDEGQAIPEPDEVPATPVDELIFVSPPEA